MMRITLTLMALVNVIAAASLMGSALALGQPLMKSAWPFISLTAANLFGAWICGPNKKPKKHPLRP